jgi:DNA mismatch repair protein MutS
MMRVKEWDGNVIFLHEVAPGAADQSYGIHVGKLAGLPDSVVSRARQVLISMGEGNKTTDVAFLTTDLPLFPVESDIKLKVKSEKSAVELELDKILPDELSPKEALEIIYKLKDIKK